MFPLEHPHSARLAPLFAGSHLRLVMDSITAGNSPATIWVDNVTAPQTALVWDTTHSVYLAGYADDNSVRRLRALVSDTLLPEVKRRRLGILKLHATNSGWGGAIDTLFASLRLTKRDRVLLRLNPNAQPHSPLSVPDGFFLQPIDSPLLADWTIPNSDDLRAEIASMWRTVDDFLTHGFGYCLRSAHTGELVCWCTAEYVSAGQDSVGQDSVGQSSVGQEGGQCGVGIETVEAYQGRGFATLTARAFVEHCVRQRITAYWDSWVSNVPSVRVAERVGFHELTRYTITVGQMDNAE